MAPHNSDLSLGYQLKLYPAGDQVLGEITLDNCGYRFTTETDRVARRQYAVVPSAGDETGISNELVAYDTAAHAALALKQAHTAAATCPKRPVRSTVSGVPALAYRVTRNESDVATLPAAMSVLTVESATGQGRVLYDIAIYQIHRRYLDAVCANLTRMPSNADIGATLALASITGHRLVATT